jgi:hypothetical protein
MVNKTFLPRPFAPAKRLSDSKRSFFRIGTAFALLFSQTPRGLGEPNGI